MFTVVIFIIVLGILVLAHELGHFVMAKRAGMKVEEFGFGFPPRIFGVRRGETIYSLNWIPFGGFVKIFGEDRTEEATKSSKSFSSKKAGAKAKVIVAGVVMNIILAFVLLSIGNVLGLRVGIEQVTSKTKDIQIQIVQVVPDSPADSAKLEMLDEITGFKFQDSNFEAKSIAEVQNFINSHRGEQIAIQIKRGNQLFEKNIMPRVNPPMGEGALGISLALTGVVKYPWYEAIYQGANQTGILLINTVGGYAHIIKQAFTTGNAGAELSGPIGIAKFTGQAARIGFAYLIQLMAILSVNLAILNIIPFPALDGGRLLFIIIEKLKGSPIPRKIENMANSVGFAFLILLMIYVTTKDVIRFF